MPITMSKSRFIRGHRCPLMLWNYCFRQELAAPTDQATQTRIEGGYEVGELVRKRYPGVLVEADHRHPQEALAETVRLLQDPSVNVIHEAAFEFQGTLVRTDVLVRAGQVWNLIEAKAVLITKDTYPLDAAFQRWVAVGAGLAVGTTSLLVLNRDYRYAGGEHNLGTLFRIVDISEEAEALAPSIESELQRLQALLQQPNAPKVLPGPQCVDQYECLFLGPCTKDWPKVPTPVDWMWNIGKGKKLGLHAQGIHHLADLPVRGLSAKQLQIMACYGENQPWVDQGLAAAMQGLVPPIHFLDFESYASAIPKLIGAAPYEATPIQWSCHTLHADGQLTHQEFLAEGNADPRAPFAESLIRALAGPGSICVYSHFERRILKATAQALPHLGAELRAITGRLVDLLKIIQAHVYLPGFRGSYSIKSVLPAMAPGFGYGHLNIQQGLAAGDAFAQMLMEPDAALRNGLREDLLRYCAQDTLAMVEILRRLKEIA